MQKSFLILVLMLLASPAQAERVTLQDVAVTEGAPGCNIRVHYPKFSRMDETDRMNDAVKEKIKAYACTPNMESAALSYNVTHLSEKLISIEFKGTLTEAGNKSVCNDHFFSMTFDTVSGELLTLKDIMPKEKAELWKREAVYAALRQIDAARKKPLKAKEEKEIIRSILSYIDERFEGYGVYIERGHVKVDLDTPVKGCAYGSAFPVDIDKDFIKDERILSQLGG